MVECSIIFFFCWHTYAHTRTQSDHQKVNKRHIFWLHAKNRCSIWFFIRFHFWNIDLCWKLVQIVIYLVTSVPFRSTCIHIETVAIAIVWEKRRRKMVHETKSNDLCRFFFVFKSSFNLENTMVASSHFRFTQYRVLTSIYFIPVCI